MTKDMVLPNYPVYVISKGRSDCCHTAKFLIRDSVPFKLVIEPQETELYTAAGYGGHLLVLPFSNLGLGSIPARNFVKDHSTAAGAERHWILDDNILGMWRRWRARKIRCQAGVAYRVVEDFVDRYENIAIAGHNYYMFAPNKLKCPPFVANVHVYSSILLSNKIPHRWRGRYNEDTDLCLQVLADGLCTVLFNAFLAWKMRTMTVKGGNSAELYKGDGRLKMARSLERAWPGVVTTQRRFQRPQHVVKGAWQNFDTPLIRRKDIDFAAFDKKDEFGMKMRRIKETKSPELQELVGRELLPTRKKRAVP